MVLVGVRRVEAVIGCYLELINVVPDMLYDIEGHGHTHPIIILTSYQSQHCLLLIVLNVRIEE